MYTTYKTCFTTIVLAFVHNHCYNNSLFTNCTTSCFILVYNLQFTTILVSSNFGALVTNRFH